MASKSIKVIFDTNVWISFLIGKRLTIIKEYIVDGRIIIITTEQLLIEIKEVTRRKKLKKYFSQKNVEELIQLLEIIAIEVPVTPTHAISRDPKDNFLLDLIDFSKADYLVTGDKDLLEHNPFRTAKIVNPSDFEKILKKIKN
ncbi:putative toxin-antitoxin system toxin component, PIN family [Galbibacter pacificus]|uniref:Toxin-antitoxin system toxin component, PIN family n=1 Tax=Galbibacter pacificus TaxID=2996052 RepID=A0ABT6FWG9_9FLAO|nr:putative toxin-antitoxin system toxin component, PIN family [Galbibacter pacificus]MDG3583971.1 putative toxin-antitoxin system toxin component, PIN family [Galbibacter pacificus]MDG3587592.1 putative toxin-antitoxin system toxin component, PIN family [Galbibacter pacificus]